MRAVVQRVTSAQVSVADRLAGRIGAGMLVLLGVAPGDTEQDARDLANRITRLRIFPDETGRMNLDLHAIGGQLLVVSQFTLLADTRSGRRPSFTGAAPPDQARALYQRFLALCRETGLTVAEGEFGATMDVELINHGPVTLIMDTRGD
jgi:D-aminoacyl-tRNA deacylase